jgi:hypothetical protein
MTGGLTNGRDVVSLNMPQEVCSHFITWHWFGEQEALRDVALQPAQTHKLGIVFYALGYDGLS